MKDSFYEGSNTDKETIKSIIGQLGYILPSDFVDVILQFDGAYLKPNGIFGGLDLNQLKSTMLYFMTQN